jgi:trigger factor
MTNRVQVEALSPIRRRFSIEVPSERVSEAIERAYAGLKREVRLKGFRQGKVPRPLLERYYGSRVEQEVASRLIQDSFSAAVVEHKVVPVAVPVIENASLEPGKAFAYTAVVEVKPEVEARDYKALPVSLPAFVPDEAQVDRRLEQLREAHAQLRSPAEPRSARRGDHVTIAFTGEVEGQARPDLVDDTLTVELGSERLIPGFEEGITGLAIGETRVLSLTFPADYREASLAGKPAVFTVTVKDLKEKLLAELDDEFAKDVGEFESHDALRTSVREAYVREETERLRAVARETLIDRLLERNPVEIPPALVEERARALLREWQHRLAHQGIDLSRVTVDTEKLGADLTARARRLVHAGLVLEAIARQEGITAEEAEVERRIAAMAEGSKQTPENLRRRLEENGRLDDVRASVLEEKTVELLMALARPE